MDLRKIYNAVYLIVGLLLVSKNYSYAQSSVLSTGTWLKVPISKTGVYKVDFNQLRAAGMDADKIDPRTLKVYGNPGGMLPQANAASRPQDLIENAIVVEGESDGVFNTSDYLLFYAQGADKQQLNAAKEILYYEHNLYADKNYVFITAGGAQGKRIQGAQLVSASASVSEFQDVVHHERALSNIQKSGREWYGEYFQNGVEQTIKVEIEGIVTGSTLKVVSDVVAYSLAGSTFSLKFNTIAVADQVVAQVPNSQYGLKARHKRDTFLLMADNISAVNRTVHDLTYRFTKNGTYSAYGHLDFLSITSTRKLAVYGNQTTFRSLKSLQQPATNFLIEKASTGIQVWEVTDPSAAIKHSIQLQGSTATFAATTAYVKEFIAFNQPLAVESITKINNQNLHGMAAVNLVIVTDTELKEEAQRLATHRSSFSGLNVAVVVNEEVYNEFSSGRPDVSAIRDFARLLHQHYPSDFRYLLLFGKGSYDYKNALPDNVNRVLTYESRNSISPLETFSSDDFFALLEDSEGEWRECFSCNETLDIGVGRIPVKKKEQAKFIVDKIINYDTNLKNTGDWQANIAFVADDGDFNTHQAQADALATYLETEAGSVFNTAKIYVDAYQQISRPAGQIAPDVNSILQEKFEQGALVLNYTGHGNEYQWANERILDEVMVQNISNERLPFLVTATCEFGRHDDPLVTSVAEVALLREKHGVIGLVTTTRPVNSSTNFDLNQAFYEALLTKQDGHFQTMGEIFKQTKNNSASGVSNRNFSLLGDPSMRLAFPQAAIAIESITTHDQSDTLKALSKVTVKGFVQGENATTDEDFNGTVTTSVYDKAASLKTLGNESPPFTYKMWSSLLFKGDASVESGRFEFSFIVPKNISYSIGNGRMSLFASAANGTAAGVHTIKVGGSAKDVEADNSPPQVRAFINDSTFTNGSTVSANTTLFVLLEDESGLNIANFGVGNDLTAILDNDVAVYELNEYYTAEANDYTKGKVEFPLRNLSPGKHRIVIKAWDTHNNSSESYVDFFVNNGEVMVIEEFGNYPNPFSEASMLFFTHNTAGEDIHAEMVLYGPQGAKVFNQEYAVADSNFRVDLGSINRNDLPSGIYLAHLFLRSETSGKQARATAKLVIVN